ncbi:thiopeptide-type bacteriocin biosynthesis protein [Microlunatus sp. GCM10028923]|uniref:thiopeptide-type bacteriocin biosynthesis protein n=1 Tax=Microlunatus sp. GCM10028923 TaxID=3273400 RepID=UPI003611F519
MAPTTPFLLQGFLERALEESGGREIDLMSIPAGRIERAYAAHMAPSMLADDHRNFRLELIRRSGNGNDPVEVDDELLSALPELLDHEWAPSYDLIMRPENSGGACNLACTTILANGGRLAGRFASLRQLSLEVVGYGNDDTSAATHAELNSLGTTTDVWNVAGSAQVLDREITMCAWPQLEDEYQVRPAEISIGIDEGTNRPYLRYNGRLLLVRATSALNRQWYPPHGRLLLDISDAGVRNPTWTWGEFGSLKSLPSVHYRGTCVSAAQYRLPPGADTADRVYGWRVAEKIPRFVRAGHADKQLLLDLAAEPHRELLARAKVATVYEALEQPDVVVDANGRPHHSEIVVSMVRRTRCENLKIKPLTDVAPWRSGVSHPGDGWWYWCVSLPTLLQNSILYELSTLLSKAEWFFVRYREEPGTSQLRVRARSAADVPAGVARFLRAKEKAGLVHAYELRDYVREIDRYGGELELERLEHLFCSESAVLASVAPKLCWPTSDEFDSRNVELAAAIVVSYLKKVNVLGGAESALRTIATIRKSRAGEHLTKVSQKQARRIIDRLALPSYSNPYSLESEPVHEIADLISELSIRPLESLSLSDGSRQSVLHMFCNRMGLSRFQEYITLYAVETVLRREVRHCEGT